MLNQSLQTIFTRAFTKDASPELIPIRKAATVFLLKGEAAFEGSPLQGVAGLAQALELRRQQLTRKVLERQGLKVITGVQWQALTFVAGDESTTKGNSAVLRFMFDPETHQKEIVTECSRQQLFGFKQELDLLMEKARALCE